MPFQEISFEIMISRRYLHSVVSISIIKQNPFSNLFALIKIIENVVCLHLILEFEWLNRKSLYFNRQYTTSEFLTLVYTNCTRFGHTTFNTKFKVRIYTTKNHRKSVLCSFLKLTAQRVSNLNARLDLSCPSRKQTNTLNKVF